MKKPKDSSNALDIKERILKSLKDEKYKYRTASGIARETHLDTEKVASILEKNPQVRVSITRAKDGSKLYSLKNRVSAASDIWTAFKAVNTAKFGG